MDTETKERYDDDEMGDSAPISAQPILVLLVTNSSTFLF